MTKRKKIYLLTGGAIFLALSITMLVLYMNDPYTEVPQSAIPETSREPLEEDVASAAGDSINIDSEEEAAGQSAAEGSNESDEEELRKAAREAINGVSLSRSTSDPSEQTFYEHSYLNQYYSNILGEHQIEEEANNDSAMREEAKWVAKELVAWINIAAEKTQFAYSETEFLEYVENEHLLQEDDSRTIALLNELKSDSESLYIRHLEFQYLKSFIWSKTQEQLKQENEQRDGETEEDYLYRLYLAFEDEVMSSLLESYPELSQSEG
ncbi:hypothetical protein SAMN05421736_109101 [Evansella caseinilytica]|uniref:Uncharacterized protein n=1 Tax=Evansella caseinilytica TaxID=1503961 RepID=A0A1H3RWQ9_9BACI|nr:hypothetical protein [Evansella caseinilytica]SDZ30102.1 hypothetical protein SAMN05421736_109101 [Evansella caseinilytica]